MKNYSVIVSAAAEADLFAIYDYIAQVASSTVALRFVDRIEAYCRSFDTVPERGTRRDDLRPGLRTVGFERRATILFAAACSRRPRSRAYALCTVEKSASDVVRGRRTTDEEARTMIALRAHPRKGI